MEFVVSAPGKVIMCGEHAVVYGKTAIASSVGLRTFLRAQPRADQKIVIELPNIDLHGEWDRQELLDLVQKHGDLASPPEIKNPVDPSLRELLVSTAKSEANSKGLAKIAFVYLYVALNRNSNTSGLHIHVTSHLPIGAGLGSSAAFSAALAAALMVWHGHESLEALDDLHKREAFTSSVNSWAFRAEKLIHGNPSGIDNCVATYGGAIAYVGGKMENLKSFPPMEFLLTNTKVPRNTMDLVAGVRVRKEKFPGVLEPLLNSIHGVSEKFTSLLESMSGMSEEDLAKNPEILKTIEELIDINHYLLNAIGVGHPSLDQVCKITQEYGLHSKLTGAGGGGCALTFVNPEKPKEKLDQAMKKLGEAGFQCFQTSIGVGGVCFHEPFGPKVTHSPTADEFAKQGITFHLNSKKRQHS